MQELGACVLDVGRVELLRGAAVGAAIADEARCQERARKEFQLGLSRGCLSSLWVSSVSSFAWNNNIHQRVWLKYLTQLSLRRYY